MIFFLGYVYIVHLLSFDLAGFRFLGGYQDVDLVTAGNQAAVCCGSLEIIIVYNLLGTNTG